MPRTTTLHAVTAIGIDMGKTTLHMIGLDARGAIVLRERVSRAELVGRLPAVRLIVQHAGERMLIVARLPAIGQAPIEEQRHGRDRARQILHAGEHRGRAHGRIRRNQHAARGLRGAGSVQSSPASMVAI